MSDTTPPEEPLNSDQQAALRIEYQLAQQSAEHHDRQAWTIVNGIAAISFIVAGLVIQRLGDGSIRWLITFLACFFIFVAVSAAQIAIKFSDVKRQKYARCCRIEEILNLEQHRKLVQRHGNFSYFGPIVMAVLVLLWLLVIATIWTYPPRP